MNNDPARKSRMTGMAVRQQSWELEALKENQRIAVDEFETAERATLDVAQVIQKTEHNLSQAMSGHAQLKLQEIQSARVFIGEQHTKYRQCAAKLRRAADRVEQAETKVKNAALAIRALERVKTSADHTVSIEREKKLLEQNMELWLQRALGDYENDN